MFQHLGQIHNFNLDGLSELEVSIGDFAGFGLALTGFLMGPWGGIISLAGWGFQNIWAMAEKARQNENFK